MEETLGNSGPLAIMYHFKFHPKIAFYAFLYAPVTPGVNSIEAPDTFCNFGMLLVTLIFLPTPEEAIQHLRLYRPILDKNAQHLER